ncbi:MAG: dihydropteroate synthase [Prevotellaceae bacterium]|jgi:dihydropteroate synthase|nr:dihydropteroate synthase [Prevotellaceae bacterium]
MNIATADWRLPLVMGIVNVTPDSFYAASRCLSESALVERIAEMVADGIDWLDLGGCSTRPGSETATEDEEWQRLEPAMRIIRRHFPRLPVSVDTFRSGIVRRLYDAYGAFIVNDISAGDDDHAMIALVGRLQLPYIAMHKRGTPQTMQQLTNYDDVVADVKAYLQRKLAELHDAGVGTVIIDPGFGFAKTVAQNYTLLRRLHEFTTLGAPLLIGISRKGMLWQPLCCRPADTLCATSALHLQALLHGAGIVRVHDVKEARQMITLAALLRDE